MSDFADLLFQRAEQAYEQGHGDAIQFLRSVPMVAALGAGVVLEIHRPLMTLAAVVAEV